MTVQLEYFDQVFKNWVRIISKFRAIWVSDNDPIEILRAQAQNIPEILFTINGTILCHIQMNSLCSICQCCLLQACFRYQSAKNFYQQSFLYTVWYIKQEVQSVVLSKICGNCHAYLLHRKKLMFCHLKTWHCMNSVHV